LAGKDRADNWTRTLGLRFAQVTPQRVVAYLDAGPQHHQPYGVLHGGVYASIVEAVASYGAGSAALESGQRGVLGVSNSTDFFRSHSVGELMCVGTPVHEGRSAHIWTVEVTRSSDGKLVARGQVRFHVLQELPVERRPEHADLEGQD
jgi:1,4-dihydroxy-2-naphthoyl-CoA hydrolase